MFFLPRTAQAAVEGAKSLAEISNKNPSLNVIISKVMTYLIMPVLEGLFLFTLLMFVWGVVGLIRNGEDSAARTTGQNHILWGTIGMLIMVSAYGIIRIISNSLVDLGGIQV